MNARSLYALSEWQGLRVWVGTRQVSREYTLLTVRFFFFREDFRGDAAVGSFVYLRFGRSRFLCRYERARSHIPMLRFGMWAPSSPQHAQRQKRACRGPRFERALALRSVGMARVEGMGGYQTGEQGIHVINREILLFSRRFSRGCSNKQFREPALGRSRFLCRYERARSNARSLYALSEWQELRVWVGTRQMSIGIHVSIAALPRCATRISLLTRI